ncbi:hypothetical protein KEM55_005796 [Ascosphaera atra]|nr:hypothetical protein KEM55_005796 [Ascosphaera atra]
MPATRARTRAAAAGSGTSQGKQPGITSFARAGKPGAGLSAAAKSSKGRNDAVGTAAVEKPPATARVEKQERAGREKELIRTASSGKKRKLGESSVGEGKDDAVDGGDSASASAFDVTKDSAQNQPTTHEPKRKAARATQPSPARTPSLRPRAARAVSSSQPSPSTPTPTPAKSPAKTPTSSLRQSPLKFNGKDEGSGSSLPVSGGLGEQSTGETGVTEPEPESDDEEEEEDGAHSVHGSVREERRLEDGRGYENGSVDEGVDSKGIPLEGNEGADTSKAPDGDQKEGSEVAAPTHLEANPPTSTDTEGEAHDTRQEHRATDVPLENDYRPESYHDLISLHASFLTALSFHYAHNNLSAPADLTELLPSIEKIWKKRSVTSDDLRRVLYIINSSSVGDEEEDKAGQQKGDEGTSKQIRIANYGPGKTCLELLGDRKKNAFAPPTNDEKLADEFCVKLERYWVQQQKDNQSSQPASSAFQKAIPLEPIHDSTTNFTTPRIGRQRVLDFTQGTLKLRSLRSANSTFSDSAARARRSSRLTSFGLNKFICFSIGVTCLFDTL